MRPCISATRTSLPASRAAKRSLIRSRSATRSTSSSSATPVSQLQKPFLGRTYTSTSPHAAPQRKARPAGQPSRGNGQTISCQSPARGAARSYAATPDKALSAKIVIAMAGQLRITASRQAGCGARWSRQFQNVHSGVGAVDDVDVAAFVGLDIVGLDRDLAAVLAVDGDAALVGFVGDRRDEVADLFGMIGIADIERADAGVEEGDERHLLVIDRRHARRTNRLIPAPCSSRSSSAGSRR